jgi:tetratricopeptide (TPR) repeat protein
VEYAWDNRDDYNALLFVTADTPQAMRRSLAAIAVALRPTLETTDDEARLQAALDWLKANPGWLLILDNIGSLAAMEEVESLVSGLAGGHVIITTRLANFSASTIPIEIDVLAARDAASFLLERTTNRRRTADDDGQKANEVALELGQLPLALEQAGAYISRHRLTFDNYLEQWRSNREKVLAWADPAHTAYPDAVSVTWQTSVAQLGDPGRRLLERLAWLAPENVPESLLDVPIPGNETEDLHHAFDDLAAYSMVLREADEPFFLVHRLVQDVTRRNLSGDRQHRSLAEALRWINAAFSGDPIDVRSWSRLDPISPHARAVTGYADAAGIWEPTSKLMSQLGLPLDAKALHAEAEPLLRRALFIDEEIYGQDSPIVAMHLNNLTLLLRATDRLTEAEPLARRALEIDERTVGPDHPSSVRSLSNLALLLQDTGRLNEAEPLLRQALTIAEKSFGPNHSEVARSLNNLAILLRATDRSSEAELLLKRALKVEEDNFGPDHPNVARSLNNLAILFQTTMRLDDAGTLFRRALEIDEKSVGPDHPKVAMRLNNLASLLQATSRTNEAEPLARRALQILGRFSKTTGHNHPYFDSVRTNYVYILEGQGRTESEIAEIVRDVVDGGVGSN